MKLARVGRICICITSFVGLVRLTPFITKSACFVQRRLKELSTGWVNLQVGLGWVVGLRQKLYLKLFICYLFAQSSTR